MAAINCNVQAPWNDRKYYRFAGTGYELHSHPTPVKEDESQSENNVKHETSHISSDGYYACLPAVPFMDDYAMDTNDAGAENSMENGRDPKNESCISALTDMPVLNENVVSVGITLRRRKRINDEYTTAEPKRQRHEEYDSVSEKVSDSSLQFMTDGCELELVEKLLKETHGCDLYHFDACDL